MQPAACLLPEQMPGWVQAKGCHGRPRWPQVQTPHVSALPPPGGAQTVHLLSFMTWGQDKGSFSIGLCTGLSFSPGALDRCLLPGSVSQFALSSMTG
jgi:hypothetical protein